MKNVNTEARYTLKMLRAKLELTQKETAISLGISESTWNKWENQKSFPNAKQISDIESLFDVNYNEIIFFNVNHGLTVKRVVGVES
ncbi:helix-turn-helix transcriptional regulator [Staphylococcus xylosus]|uniref:helix-turn-helix transcriptional regulator n=1 Tax=Staphylococcus xylosus TaxID=1288 RepID=UPI001E342279|nr:helix-turn-helix transcriptional regulator [Staphylococcus xylosus]MCD8851668.1 helix-turn-helix domain-containing protein [Staphylococcus xylosus]